MSLQPECHKLDLSDYLIKPLQRICRYPLFLKELAKFTPDNHAESIAIQKANQTIQNTIKKINEGVDGNLLRKSMMIKKK